MNMQKRFVWIIGILFLISSIFIVSAVINKISGAWHSGTNFDFVSNGIKHIIPSQKEYLGDYYTPHTYSLPTGIINYIPPSHGHNVDKIWVSVNGIESDLLTALKTPKRLCSKTGVSSYKSGPSDKSIPYHLASEIEFDSTKSLQDAIDEGFFCYDYFWKTSDWGACTSDGKRRRIVGCYIRELITDKLIDDAFCIESKPITEENCPYSWVVSNWGNCISQCCGWGKQSRTVSCKYIDGSVVSNSLCEWSAPPSSERDCVSDDTCNWNIESGELFHAASDGCRNWGYQACDFLWPDCSNPCERSKCISYAGFWQNGVYGCKYKETECT